MRVKDLIPKSINTYMISLMHQIFYLSLRSAARQQGMERIASKLQLIVPDITEQYSTFKLDSPYLTTKVRNQHTFQVSLLSEIINEFAKPVIVDIGDSAGTHLQYLIGLYGKEKNIECLSVNLDDLAIEKIKRKGLKAIKARAEDLASYNINADIFLCFQLAEHLTDPCRFLHQLSSMTGAKYLIISVTYLKRSRVGLHHIRATLKNFISAERTHIFELCPEDWKLIVRHSGWEVVYEKVYLQYPRFGFWHLAKPLWRKYDFEGFYGLVLKRDSTFSSKYLDW